MRHSTRNASKPSQAESPWLTPSELEALDKEIDQSVGPRSAAVIKRNGLSAGAGPSSSTATLQSLPPTAILQILQLNSHPSPLRRWQMAASFAMNGAFGSAWKEFMPLYWESEVKRIGVGGGKLDYTGPYTTVKALKEAAKDMKLGINVLSAKKGELLAVVPQLVPACIVAAARDALKAERAQRDFEALKDDGTVRLDYCIARPDAKERYRLNEADLASLGQRRLKLKDVIKLAYEKHGGAEGVKAAIEDKNKRLEARREAAARRAAKEAAERRRQWALQDERKQYLRTKLEERGLPGSDCERRFFSDYIYTGEKDLEQLLDIYAAKIAAKRDREQRLKDLPLILQQRNLPPTNYETLDPYFGTYIESGDPNELESALQRYHQWWHQLIETQKAKKERTTRVLAALRAQGIPESYARHYASNNPDFQQFIASGDEHLLQSGLQADLQRYQQLLETQKVEEERKTRVTRIQSMLEAADIPQIYARYNFELKEFIASGEEHLLQSGLVRAAREKKREAETKAVAWAAGERICCIDGCSQLYGTDCTGRVCGTHSKLCSDPRCKRHPHANGR